MGWTDDVLTVEYKLNFLRPGVGERLRAEASVL
jgi:acyl-coenzyme A thioesterase PaaI-like protein